MKKYLLLVEDESLWERFKSITDKDINSEIIQLIKEKVSKKAPAPKGVPPKGGKGVPSKGGKK